MRASAVVLTLTAGFALACAAELGGSTTIDGAPFAPIECRSGAVHGFVGVELIEPGARSLRLALRPDGQADAFLFTPGDSTGTPLGACGPMSVTEQSSEINGVKNVEGAATLSCSDGAHTVAGTVTWANCH